MSYRPGANFQFVERNSKRTMLPDEELAQRLGAFPALAEDLVGFNPQHQHGISPLPLTPVPGGSNALFWPRRAPGIPEVHTHSGGQSHIHVKKIKIVMRHLQSAIKKDPSAYLKPSITSSLPVSSGVGGTLRPTILSRQACPQRVSSLEEHLEQRRERI